MNIISIYNYIEIGRNRRKIYAEKIKYIYVCFTCNLVCITYCIGIIFTCDATRFILPPIKQHPIKEDPAIIQILVGVFAAPVYETVIFQVFLFWVLRCIPFIKDRVYLIILIASIIFGLSHSDGITYIVVTAIIGVLYNYAYWVYQKE